ncbi:hypothetical protein PENTCL1PPCAC_18082 [Pristionchus entomophagus]|uniref:Zinc finger PHD-type domain-containing protein n=1 Tax=Pristionchus entomophagus TaxID=358040 RepID=A0AAV5TNG2_9BILA|nr:hypothetical protein PENTCL1PPCAC_18082 [Pristionchus entomophagus]
MAIDGIPLSCECRKPRRGVMIFCDNSKCNLQVFHMECVGMTAILTSDVRWYCRLCRPRYRDVVNQWDYEKNRRPDFYMDERQVYMREGEEKMRYEKMRWRKGTEGTDDEEEKEKEEDERKNMKRRRSEWMSEEEESKREVKRKRRRTEKMEQYERSDWMSPKEGDKENKKDIKEKTILMIQRKSIV